MGGCLAYYSSNNKKITVTSRVINGLESQVLKINRVGRQECGELHRLWGSGELL